MQSTAKRWACWPARLPGVVTWEVWGLTSKRPIKSVGTFTLKRVFNAKELEP